MLIDRELIKEFGNLFFDEKLFLYHEDVDVSWQCRLLNYKLGYVPKAVCYHKVGASAGRRSVRNAYYSFRNRIRVLIKNYGSFSLSVFLPLAIMIKMISIFGNVLLERNPQYFKVISSALWWNMKNISETLKERRRIQKMRRVSDRTIIKKMRKVPVEMIYFLKSTR